MTPDPSAERLSPARLNAFWAIIEASRGKAVSQDMQLAALKAKLAQLSPQGITEFAETMDGLLDASYSWKLWGAAYVMMGGASDDSFEYFRIWLVAQGREFFERAAKNPDAIADMLPASFDEIPEFEEMAYAATEAWEAKTGSEEFDAQPNMMPMRTPDGDEFAESEAELAQTYPKLYARFGDNPLQ